MAEDTAKTPDAAKLATGGGAANAGGGEASDVNAGTAAGETAHITSLKKDLALV